MSAANKRVTRLEEKIQKHYNFIKRISEVELQQCERRLEAERNDLASTLRRRELTSMLKKIFDERNFDARMMEGYVSYEIARDFIDGRQAACRQLVLVAVDLIKCELPSFWIEAAASEESWSKTFGCEERFRIPAHDC